MKRSKFLSSKKVMLASLLAFATVATGVLGYSKVNATMIQDCTTNSIIKCGVQSPSDLINRVKANNPSDLQSIYGFSAFGLTSTDYNRFATTARSGMALRDGRIVVDGQTVATDSSSIGRNKFSYSVPMTIAGHTYYVSRNADVLNQDLPVMVMFNDKGVMQTAVMNACGNPTTGGKVTPHYSCDLLQKAPVAGKPNTYNFTTKATATNNAKLAKVVYDFGDGTSATSTSLTTPVQHAYTKEGTFTAKVTVYVSLPGNQTATVTSAQCQTTIVVPPSIQACVALTALTVDVPTRKFRFTVTTKQSNGATLKDAKFNFGDNTSVVTVAATTPTTVVAGHTYAKAGAYTITATVDFNTLSGVKSVSCTTKINITPEMCAIKPDVPKDSPLCKVCEFNPQLPAGSEACQPPVTPPTPEVPPTELPNTGVGSVVSLFGAALVAGVIGHRMFLSRRLSRS